MSSRALQSPRNVVFQKPASCPQPQDLELPRRREDRWRGRAEHPSLIQGSGRVAGGSPQETSVPGAHAPTLPGGSR